MPSISGAFDGVRLDLDGKVAFAEFGKERVRVEVFFSRPHAGSQWSGEDLLDPNRHIHRSTSISVAFVERIGMADDTARHSAGFAFSCSVANGEMNFVTFLRWDSTAIFCDVSVDHGLQHVEGTD